MNSSLVKKANIHRWDWLSAILLIIIMQISAARLAATLWTRNLDVVEFVTLLGTILGLALGKSIFRRFWVILLSIFYGIVVIPWQLSLPLDSDLTYSERMVILWERLQLVIKELVTRNPITDSLLFLTLMSLLFWVLAIYSAVALARDDNPWKVILPGGVAAFVIHSFDPLLVSRSWYLAFYLFFALILVARIVYLKNTARWRDNRTHTPPDMGFDLSRVALILSMILVFFAWNVPVVAETFRPAAEIWQSASRPWLSAKDRLSFMFASLRASVGLVENYYGPTLTLGLGSPLSNQVVMEVQAPTTPPNGGRFYWEARAYDTYQANQWFSNLTVSRDLTPNTVDLSQPGAEIREEVLFKFSPFVPISNLYVVSEPLWLSLPAQAYMANNPDGTVNFSAFLTKGIVHPGESYSVRAAVDAMTILQLRDAGTIYPDWVVDDYLQLPASITPRTKELAQAIASGLNTPYDIAHAITQWLRNNIEYNQSVDRPPANQDRVDWFLFDYKKGYCLYYASAEVILLRSLGIPARMAVGYAQGEQETSQAQQPPAGVSSSVTNPQELQTSNYIVRKKDAHAWPEIYFPGLGWIIFEPTVSQPDLTRPTGISSTPPVLSRDLPQEDPGDNLPPERNTTLGGPADRGAGSGDAANANFWSLANIARLAILIFAIALLGFVVWHVRRGFRVRPLLERLSLDIPVGVDKGLRRMGIRSPDFLVNWIYFHRLPAISRSYLEINRALDRLGKPPAIQDTPSERTDSLVAAIPETTRPARYLLTQYQASVYSYHPSAGEKAHLAGSVIRRASRKLWMERLLKRFITPKRAQEN
ncbi:MAG: transglutaminase-like domain-containing protein [Acidobacteriaceae bacterium]